MLVLTRREQGKIFIGEDITITIIGIRRGMVRIGIDAPAGVEVVRDDAICKEPRGSKESPQKPPVPADAACDVKPSVGMAAADYESDLIRRTIDKMNQKRDRSRRDDQALQDKMRDEHGN